jgi:chemotaxis regulatin CheY-phosphate phosphatase CheZ
MEKLNLGLELKALVSNLTGLVTAVSGIRAALAQNREQLPPAAERLGKITSEAENAARQVMEMLDGLQQGDSAAAQLLARLEPLCHASPEAAEAVEGLKKITDRNQQDHTRILEILQFQDLTFQHIHYLSSLLEKVEKEMEALLSAFSVPL